MGFLNDNGKLSLLFYLLCGHALMDYALQTPTMALLKSPRYHGKERRIYGPWWWSMGAHSLMNGLWVGYVMHEWWLGFLETLVHFGLDTAKCLGKITRDQDQLGHVMSKLLWIFIG